MNTKQDIIRSYLTLGAENGFDNTSLSDIARELGIRKPTLFSHFDNFDTIKTAAEDLCRDALEHSQFNIDFKAKSKEKLFDSFMDSYSEIFSNYPLNCYVSLLEQKSPYLARYREMNNQLNLMICSRLTVALDFSVQHGWSDIKDTDRLAWLLTLSLRDGSENSTISFSEF